MSRAILSSVVLLCSFQAAAVRADTPVKPQGRYCFKCKATRPASHKFCPKCGTPTVTRTRATTRASTKRLSTPKRKPTLKRYESGDGKLVLYHPQGWSVQPGAASGPGSYGAMIQNRDRTAAVMFLTLPLGQQVTDSVAMARIHLADLARANRAVDVTWMKSSKDRSRTRLETRLTTADGQQVKAHIFYFHTPRIGTVFSLMAAPDKWQTALPLLTQIVANLAYSPEGVRNIQNKARKLAASDRRVPRPNRRALSPMAMLAAAQSGQGRQLPLVQVTAPDQSFTIRIPRGWQWQGGVLQYWTSPDWQCKTHGVSFVSKEMLSPRATSIRVPGVIVSDYVPPPQALALVMADGKLGRGVKIIAETPATQIVPEVAQYLQMLEGRGLRGDIRLMHVRFVNIPTGQTCRGLFSVSCFVSTLGLAWSCLIEGGWAPDREFDDYLPLYWRIVQSNRYNEHFVGRAIAQQAARQRQLNQSLQRALAESREAFQGLQASFRRNSETRDYTSWLFSQTTLGHGSWVSQAEGGTLHQTDRWGIQRETGDRVDLPEYNTFNFTGRSRWTGENLNEINTLPEWQRHIRGRR